ncbi:MAG: formate dehydrogenase subunit gamma [Bacteroidales bacterium]
MSSHDTRTEGGRVYLRFDRYHRTLHGLLMLSFLGLALTGLPLLFSDAPWAVTLAHLYGGFRAAGIAHRVFAVLLIGVFCAHVFRLMERLFVNKELHILWGPGSMVPQPRDVVELLAHMRWFLGLGARPRFDHFTYWEKFDYWAVFWGMGIIGFSGLVLWFPLFFSRLLPGSFFNIAMLVHGEEALLAVGFIFTIHFFNSHLRPEKFPMDTVIFTGRVTDEELREERPEEFERLQRERALDRLQVAAAKPWVRPLGRTIGTVAVCVGLTLVVLIIYALLTAGPTAHP